MLGSACLKQAGITECEISAVIQFFFSIAPGLLSCLDHAEVRKSQAAVARRLAPRHLDRDPYPAVTVDMDLPRYTYASLKLFCKVSYIDNDEGEVPDTIA